MREIHDGVPAPRAQDGTVAWRVPRQREPVEVPAALPPAPAGFPTARLFDLDLAAATREQVVAAAHDAIRRRNRLLVGVLNAAKVVNLRREEVLRHSLLECDVLLADGQAVVWASRVLGRPLPERVAGIDLFEDLLALADREHLRVYLLGARPEVLDRVVGVVGERWPGAVVVGHRDGYFPDQDSARVAAEIAAAAPDMVFLGMSSPRKETFLGSYAEGLGVPVLHGVGGSFDVLAGVTRRAPQAWQRAGMEWAYRMLQEPRRLGRRYLTTNTLFVLAVLRERARRSDDGARTSEETQMETRMESQMEARTGARTEASS
jgi:N-acetylglucosaminyldiphosphoundecaprenol N-acetyl-beta-D-mannosaminyltransferase